jgi:hypothetical protein
VGWWDWLDTGGGTAWETNYDAAVEQALEWIETVADARGWSSSEEAKAIALVEDARDEAEGFADLDDTFTVKFWAALSSSWGSISNPPEGWDGLGETFASASGASYDPIERAVDSVSEFVTDVASDVNSVVNPSKSPWPWVVGGVVLFFVVRELRR